jgi:hypothetical protein
VPKSSGQTDHRGPTQRSSDVQQNIPHRSPA